MCLWGAPGHVYKGARGGGQRPHRVRPKGGILLLLGVGSPFPSPTRRGRKEGERRRKEGAGPQSPKPIRFGPRGGAPHTSLLHSISTKAHEGPLTLPANSRNSLVLRKIPESLGTFPMSEYSRPICQSLRLDHFETPRHVPDLIRDSEVLWYIKTHKLII